MVNFHINVLLQFQRYTQPMNLHEPYFLYQGKNAQYVWHKEQFDAVDAKTTDCLMGKQIISEMFKY